MVRTISAPNMHLRHIVCTFRGYGGDMWMWILVQWIFGGYNRGYDINIISDSMEYVHIILDYPRFSKKIIR
jgi:hypothetical protein